MYIIYMLLLDLYDDDKPMFIMHDNKHDYPDYYVIP